MKHMCEFCGHIGTALVKQTKGPLCYWFCTTEHQLAYWHVRYTQPQLYRYIRAAPAERSLAMVSTNPTEHQLRVVRVLSKIHGTMKMPRHTKILTPRLTDVDRYARDKHECLVAVGRQRTENSRRRRLPNNCKPSNHPRRRKLAAPSKV